MKKVWRILLTCCMALTMLCGCGQAARDQKVKELISEFETSIQNVDIDAITECIDPAYINPINAVLSVAGTDITSLAGLVDTVFGSDAFGKISEQYESARDEMSSYMKTFRIKPLELEYNEDNDRCTVKAEVSIDAGGETKTQTTNIKCVLKEDVWYITLH